jgi:hypothetical protein
MPLQSPLNFARPSTWTFDIDQVRLCRQYELQNSRRDLARVLAASHTQITLEFAIALQAFRPAA